MKVLRFLNPAKIFIVILTIVLFVVAVFVKGFTSDLLLEIAVFLVSAKLVLMAQNNAETNHRLEQQLVEIRGLMERISPGREESNLLTKAES